MELTMPDLTPMEVKQAMKDGLKEWLDEKWSDFGKWSAIGIGASALGVLAYVILIANGWHKV